MDLKNAAAVCIISLFSATLVLLIARALDLGTASRLEPQLAKIVEELEAIRKAGGIAPSPGEEFAGQPADDALMVCYFHGVRCATCRAAESNALDTLRAHYASQLKGGQVVWKVLDYMKDPTAAQMAKDFKVTTSTIVLVKRKGGQMDVWNRLDRVLALAEDKPALSMYLQEEIDKMLEPAAAAPAEPPPVALPEGTPAIPVPSPPTPDTPVPPLPRGNPMRQ